MMNAAVSSTKNAFFRNSSNGMNAGIINRMTVMMVEIKKYLIMPLFMSFWIKIDKITINIRFMKK